MDMRKIISVKQWGGWVLSLLLMWLVGVNICQAGSGDEVLAYFSANASGRQELYEFAVAKLGADKASESDKARVQRNLQQVANMAGLSTEDWRLLVSDNSKFNAYALPGYIFVITQGAVDELTDAEMQVIFAHELAHEMLGHPTAAIKRSPMSMKYLRRAEKKKDSTKEYSPADYWEAMEMSVVRKQEEKAADIWAAELLSVHDFDLTVAINLWEKLRSKYGEIPYDSNHLTYRQRSRIFADYMEK